MNPVLRVLLIDDEESLAESVQDLFDSTSDSLLGPEFNGIEFEVCAEFERALDKLTNSRFDLVVLDIIEDASRTATSVLDLERMGLQVFQNIRERQFVPVIFYAGDPSPAHGLGDAPFVQYVSKGDDPDDFARPCWLWQSRMTTTLRASRPCGMQSLYHLC